MNFHLLLAIFCSVFIVSFVRCEDNIVVYSSETGVSGENVTLSLDYSQYTLPEKYNFDVVWRKGVEIICTRQICTSNRYKFSNDNTKTIKLQIAKSILSDRGNYSCYFMIVPQSGGKGRTITSEIALEINKTPIVTTRNIDVKVLENQVGTVGTCYANSGKPLPKIWFEDESGNHVETQASLINVTDKETGLINASLDLKKLFTRQHDGKRYTCVVEHDTLKNTNKGLSQTLEPIVVHYKPSIEIRTVEATKVGDTFYIKQEKSSFFADCFVDANPPPKYVNWTFVPDTQDTNYTLPEGLVLPHRFTQEGAYKVQYTKDKKAGTHLLSPILDLLDNGTFVCKTDNGIGTNEASLRLGVYVTPTTTPAPTTPAKIRDTTTTTVHIADITVGMEHRQAGSDAAIIGGIVAVVCFVAVVFLILVIRYFCSHKATYHTNEAKETNDFEAIPHTKEEKEVELESEISETNEELLLQDKRRPEYFM